MRTLRCMPLVFVFAVAACTTVEPSPQWKPGPGTQPAGSEKVPAGMEKPPASLAPAAAPAFGNDIHWVRNSAEYRAAFLQTYTLATRRIEELAAGLPAGGWAVALDGDETVISNVQFEKEMGGKSWTDAEWQAWVERKEATALPGARVFLARVRELGGKIAIVTNRGMAACPATEENFRLQNLAYDLMLCKADNSEKEPRWDAIEQGTAAAGVPPLKIVLWVGDNIQDFPGLDQSLRLQPETAYQEFGTRFFVLPNPMYGSFTKNPRE